MMTASEELYLGGMHRDECNTRSQKVQVSRHNAPRGARKLASRI